MIIVTAVLASLLEIIDTSIVNVAIPTMMGNLGATLEDISMVVTGYIVANAIVLPLSGWLGSRIGRRKYYFGCIIAFTLTSVACGLAPNLTTLVIFRIFQGLAGGALLPTSQALIQEQFSRERAGMGSAIYGMSVMIGPTVGPTLGGYLTDNFGWRSIFNINLPLGLIAAALAYAYISDVPLGDEEKKEGASKKSPIDGIGLSLLAIGIGSLQFMLERGQADDWFDSRLITTCAVLAAICLPAFVWWELRVRNPIVNLRLFKENAVRNGTMLMMAVGLMLFGSVFILPVFIGNVLRYNATQTGELFIPGSLLTAACMPFVGILLKKRDPRVLIFFGVLVIEIYLFTMTAFSTQTGYPQLFWSLILRGLGMAFLFVPINTVVLGQFRGPDLAQAAGLMNLFRQIGGSIGIALIATLLSRNSAQNYLNVVEHVSLLEPATREALRQSTGAFATRLPTEVGFDPHSRASYQAIYDRVQQQVFVLSFTQMMWYLFILFGMSLVPLVLLKVKRKITGPVDAH